MQSAAAVTRAQSRKKFDALHHLMVFANFGIKLIKSTPKWKKNVIDRYVARANKICSVFIWLQFLCFQNLVKPQKPDHRHLFTLKQQFTSLSYISCNTYNCSILTTPTHEV